MGDFGWKETKEVSRAVDSCMLNCIEKGAAAIGFSPWSPRCWDLENRISCCVIMWTWWGSVLRGVRPCAVGLHASGATGRKTAVVRIKNVPPVKRCSLSSFGWVSRYVAAFELGKSEPQVCKLLHRLIHTLEPKWIYSLSCVKLL